MAAIEATTAQVQTQAQNNNCSTAADTGFGKEQTIPGSFRYSSFNKNYSGTAPPSLGPSMMGWHGCAFNRPGHDQYGAAGSPEVLPPIYTPTRRSALAMSLQSLQDAPRLIRTSCIQSGPSKPAQHLGGSLAAYPTQAVLDIIGNLDAMAKDWSTEEWKEKRRIVLFRKKQNGNHLEMSFKPVPIRERLPRSICISCIYWAEKNECFVTSVDAIYLLEHFLAAPSRYTVEEKNRIRRNLEGFKPLTVSKAKVESVEFFEVIMGLGNPKPRNIEKDIKVFAWKTLGPALKKIISKYSINPSLT